MRKMFCFSLIALGLFSVQASATMREEVTQHAQDEYYLRLAFNDFNESISRVFPGLSENERNIFVGLLFDEVDKIIDTSKDVYLGLDSDKEFTITYCEPGINPGLNYCDAIVFNVEASKRGLELTNITNSRTMLVTAHSAYLTVKAGNLKEYYKQKIGGEFPTIPRPDILVNYNVEPRVSMSLTDNVINEDSRDNLTFNISPGIRANVDYKLTFRNDGEIEDEAGNTTLRNVTYNYSDSKATSVVNNVLNYSKLEEKPSITVTPSDLLRLPLGKNIDEFNLVVSPK